MTSIGLLLPLAVANNVVGYTLTAHSHQHSSYSVTSLVLLTELAKFVTAVPAALDLKQRPHCVAGAVPLGFRLPPVSRRYCGINKARVQVLLEGSTCIRPCLG